MPDGILHITKGQQKGAAVTYALDLARALQRYGIPSHRLEEQMVMLNDSLGIVGHYFSSPSTIMASFNHCEDHRSYIIRAVSGDLNLWKLDDLMALNTRVVNKEVSPEDGANRIKEILDSPDHYGPIPTVISFMLVSASAARLFGGGWREVLTSSCIGLFLAFLVMVGARRHSLGKLVPPLAALGAALLSLLAVGVLGPFSTDISTITGLIVLIPGLTLTVAMIELATGHPISGTARFANAAVVFLMMGFGIALGNQIGQRLPIEFIATESISLPQWTKYVAMLAISITFTVLFQAKMKDTPVIFGSALIAFYGTQMGNDLLGPQLAGFVPAFILGIWANLFARWTGRPGAIVQVPGIMLLVPGSVGFRSVSSMLNHDVLAGLETAFNMSLAATSLVAGLLFANLFFARNRPI